MLLDGTVEYLTWDNVEAITLEVSRKGGVYMSVAVPGAKRRALSLREMAASGGVYQAGDITWLIPAVLYPKSLEAPKPADVVIDGDRNEYTVLSAQGQRRDATGYQTYKLVCRNLRVAYLMQDLLTVESVVGTHLDTSGVEIKDFAPVVTGVPCRFQEIGNEVKDGRAIRGTERRFEIFLSRELDIDIARSRIPYSGVVGGALDITGYRSRMSITDLPTLEAVGRV